MNRYFYIDNEGKQRGTFSPEELKQENIKPETLVWTQGMEQWVRADEVSELSYIFDQTSAEEPMVVSQTDRIDYRASGGGSMPKTWLVESILVTILPSLFCSNFLSLLGIVAIVYASQVESYYKKGDYAEALSASQSAGKWTKIVFWISIGWVLLIIITMVVLFGIIGFSLAAVGDLMYL